MLRLVKVVVQPFFVLDDGESLQEINIEPKVVSAKDWPTYSAEEFQREMAQLEAQLEGVPNGVAT